MLVSPLCHESFSECADGNQPIRFSFSAFSLSEKRFRERCFSDSISKVERVPTVFPQKSLIIFSSKREKSVEYRVRGTFPEKKFPPTGCKIWKKCGIQGEEVFSKNFSLKPQKSVEYRVRGLSLKKSSHWRAIKPEKSVEYRVRGKIILRVHWQPNKGIPR